MKKVIWLSMLFSTCSIYSMGKPFTIQEDENFKKPVLTRSGTQAQHFAQVRMLAFATEDSRELPIFHPENKPKTGACCQQCALVVQSNDK